MRFTEASEACKKGHVVYRDGVPHIVEYATAGGAVRPIEGIAHIRRLNETAQREVSVHDINLTKELDEDNVIANYECLQKDAEENNWDFDLEKTTYLTSQRAGVSEEVVREVLGDRLAACPAP